ncbi:MAG: hypothetical protein GXO48_05670 [Chlorobi bacterium]|nr:hypothetical protein [Chlorobiota bacterium]
MLFLLGWVFIGLTPFLSFGQDAQQFIKETIKSLNVSCDKYIIAVFPYSPASCPTINSRFLRLRNKALRIAENGGCVVYLLPQAWQQFDKESIFARLSGSESFQCEYINFVDFSNKVKNDDLINFVWVYDPHTNNLISYEPDAVNRLCYVEQIEQIKINPYYKGSLQSLVHVDSLWFIFYDAGNNSIVFLNRKDFEIDRTVNLNSVYCEIYKDVVNDSTCLKETSCDEILQFLYAGSIQPCQWKSVSYTPTGNILLEGTCRVCDTIIQLPELHMQSFAGLAETSVNVSLSYPDLTYKSKVYIFEGPVVSAHEPIGCINTESHKVITSGNIKGCQVSVSYSHNTSGSHEVLIYKYCDGNPRVCLIHINSEGTTPISAVIAEENIYIWDGLYIRKLKVW